MKKFKEIQLTKDNRIPVEKRTEYFKEAMKNGMTLTTIDLETCHAIVRTYYIGSKVNIQQDQVIHPVKIMTAQYGINGGKPDYFKWKKISNKFENTGNFCDKKLIEDFVTKVYNKADLILTQNGDSFDHKIIAERAKYHGTTPPLRSIPSIDILKLSRKAVRPMSHRLDYRSKQLGLGGKKPMGRQDWIDVEDGVKCVTKKMVPYGLKDISDPYKLLFRELPYYVDIPTKVEQVVLKFLTKGDYVHPKTLKSIRCPNCSRIRRKATDVVHLKGVSYKCNNCNRRFSANLCG